MSHDFLNVYLINGDVVFHIILKNPVTKPKQSLNIFCLVISLAIVMERTPESKYYEVVHPKRLHILHKRELQNNQKEKLGREVRNAIDLGVFIRIWEIIENLFAKRSDDISLYC